MPELTELQKRQCDESQWDFSDLRALYINCTLKRSPEVSHTQGLDWRDVRRGSTACRVRFGAGAVAAGLAGSGRSPAEQDVSEDTRTQAITNAASRTPSANPVYESRVDAIRAAKGQELLGSHPRGFAL